MVDSKSVQPIRQLVEELNACLGSGHTLFKGIGFHLVALEAALACAATLAVSGCGFPSARTTCPLTR
jgi:hypothetical protein